MERELRGGLAEFIRPEPSAGLRVVASLLFYPTLPGHRQVDRGRACAVVSAGANGLTPAMRDALRGLPLLSGLSTSALELLDEHVEESTVPAGHFILKEGDPGTHIFLIDRGTVRIFKAGRGSADRELARLEEGGFFGEMGILDRDGRSASVQAVTETRLIILSFVAFEILSDLQPLDYARFLENLARELVRRLRNLDDRFTTIT